MAHGGTVTGRVFSKTISVLIFKKLLLCFFGLCVCVYVHMHADTRREQKRASDPSKPELQAVVGWQTRVELSLLSCTASSCLLLCTGTALPDITVLSLPQTQCDIGR